jgi:hypothetical protein
VTRRLGGQSPRVGVLRDPARVAGASKIATWREDFGPVGWFVLLQVKMGMVGSVE